MVKDDVIAFRRDLHDSASDGGARVLDDDLTIANIQLWLDELSTNGPLRLYEAGASVIFGK
jgi:hypothetical protein